MAAVTAAGGSAEASKSAGDAAAAAVSSSSSSSKEVAKLKSALEKAEKAAADAKKIAVEQSKLAIVQEEKALSSQEELKEVAAECKCAQGKAEMAKCQVLAETAEVHAAKEAAQVEVNAAKQAAQVAKEAAVHYQAEAAKAIAQKRKRVAQAKRAARRAQEKLLCGCGLPADMLPEDDYDGEAPDPLKAPPAPCAPPGCSPNSDVVIAKALLDRLTAAASPAKPCLLPGLARKPPCLVPEPPKCDTKTTKAAEKGDKKIEVASVAGISNGSQIIVGNEIRVVEDVDAEKREITLADELLADRGDGTSVKLMPAAPCEAAPPPPGSPCPAASPAAAQVAAAAAAAGITPPPPPPAGLQESSEDYSGESEEKPASLFSVSATEPTATAPSSASWKLPKADAKKGVLQASDIRWSSLTELDASHTAATTTTTISDVDHCVLSWDCASPIAKSGHVVHWLWLSAQSVGVVMGSHGYVCAVDNQEAACGQHGRSYDWCNTTDGKWDYCVRRNETSAGLNCTGSGSNGVCGLHGKKYYWCDTTDGKWDHCVPKQLSSPTVVKTWTKSADSSCNATRFSDVGKLDVDQCKEKCEATTGCVAIDHIAAVQPVVI
jgi:hypothetical protein